MQNFAAEKRTIKVDPGEVEIFVKIDWCRSRVARMSVNPGSKARLFCRARSLLTVFYGITLGRHDYVRLEPA